ncbi:MAG: substrate-binding domain-containing protein [Chitinophagaceae bacterium]
MQKKTSLKDIAARVGVSTALVSYVLNGRMEGRIGKEVAKKIRQTATKLNYQPNHIARSLKTRRTNTIGLVVADISNPFSSSLARIIEDEADKLGYTVIFGSSDETDLKSGKLINALMNRQVDGLIIFPPANSEKQIRQLIKQGTPFVLVDRYFPGIDCNSVGIDNHKASFEAVTHLLDQGRKRIGMISYNSTLHHLDDRIEGYKSALKAGNIEPTAELIRKVDIGNNTVEIGKAVQSLLDLKKPVDAILFGSNRIAAAGLKYIHSKKIHVPEKVSLVGFDETEIFDFFYSPLTYIRQPLTEIGQQATRMLLEGITNPKTPVRIFLPAQLVIRESSMPVKKKGN